MARAARHVENARTRASPGSLEQRHDKARGRPPREPVIGLRLPGPALGLEGLEGGFLTPGVHRPRTLGPPTTRAPAERRPRCGPRPLYPPGSAMCDEGTWIRRRLSRANSSGPDLSVMPVARVALGRHRFAWIEERAGATGAGTPCRREQQRRPAKGSGRVAVRVSSRREPAVGSSLGACGGAA